MQELIINSKIKVFTDKKTNARTIAIPFRLSDGTNAVAMISRLKAEEWNPQEEIKSITINYNEN